MSLRKLPEIHAEQRLETAQFDLRPDAVERWEPGVHAGASSDATLSILDVIGEGWDGTGVTAKRIGAALRAIGHRDVVVDINSPGGDFFEGVAIYNQLRAHPGKVTVRVLGLAASAASVIAMAGDDIQMGDGAFMMIHNAWAVAIGNRHDLADVAAQLAPFDAAMADLYAQRTGITATKAAQLMDEETWMNTAAAVASGFADGALEGSAVVKDDKPAGNRKALAMVEAAMAKAGHSRTARRETLRNLFTGTPRAADPAMPSAGDDTAALLQTIITNIRG